MNQDEMKELIEDYLELYSETQGVLPEKIEEFGEKYREQGYLDQEQLYELAYETATRSAHHVRRNPEERCRKVTENVRKLDDDFSRIALVCSLKGFKAAVGSAVLTALDPENHAVIDTRVWASLDRLGYLEGRRESFRPEHYVKMIQPIREISEETGFSSSEVGYALFAYDWEKREGNLH